MIKKQTVLLLSALCCTLLHAAHDANPISNLNRTPAAPQEMVQVPAETLQLFRDTLIDLAGRLEKKQEEIKQYEQGTVLQLLKDDAFRTLANQVKQQQEEIELRKQNKQILIYTLGVGIPGAFIAGATTATLSPKIPDAIKNQMKNPNGTLRADIAPWVIQALMDANQLNKQIPLTVCKTQINIHTDELAQVLYYIANYRSKAVGNLAISAGTEFGYKKCTQLIHHIAEKSNAKKELNDTLEELLPQDGQPKSAIAAVTKLAIQYGLQQLVLKCITSLLFSNLMPITDLDLVM